MSEGNVIGESYGSQDIQNEKVNIQFLILRQIDRTNWLKSISFAGKSSRNEQIALLQGLRGSIQSVELLMAPFLSKDTLVRTKAVKSRLDEEYSFRAVDGVVRSNRLLQTMKFELSRGGEKKKSRINNDLIIYMDLLDEWNMILMENLGKANLTPSIKTKQDFGLGSE